MQGEIGVADEAINRIGVMLEQLGARFDLVLEAVTGFGGRIEGLRSELTGQFTEVGRQIRFISDRLAENRDASTANRADLGAEMIRLGEMLGATRVEMREQLGSLRHELSHNAETTAAIFASGSRRISPATRPRSTRNSRARLPPLVTCCARN